MSARVPSARPGETIVWLARHGKVHNPTDVLYGRLPRMRLSDEGVRQAGALADFLSARPLAAVYSSPMLRARRTAALIAARHPDLSVRRDRDLMEIKTSWQGRPHADLASIGFDFYANPLHPDDETLEMIRDRMLRWARRVVRRHAGGEVVGVSHGDPVLILVGALRGLPMIANQLRPVPYIPTACVFRLRFDAEGTFQEAELHVPYEEEAAA